MECDCILRSYHDSEVCDPCGHAEWELTDAEVFDLIAEIPDVRHRRQAFDALAQIHEEAAA